MLARPGLTIVVDGIVVPTDSIRLTIELLDRAKIGVLIYGLLFLLSSAYAAAPNRLSPYPGQTGSRRVEKNLEEAARLLAEGIASLTGNVAKLTPLVEQIRAALRTAGWEGDRTATDANDNVPPPRSASRSDGPA